MGSKKIPAVANELTSKQECLGNDNGIENIKTQNVDLYRSNKNITNGSNGHSNNICSYLGYGMVCLLLAVGSSEAMAVNLDQFGTGMATPLVNFATKYWVYGAGIGGIATSLLSEGDGRVRIIRGGTVFVGASSICMGILASLPVLSKVQ